MVGSITAAFVLFSLSLSRSLCVLRRRVKLVFTLVLVFVSCLFSRVEWVWLGQTDETKFPLRVDMMLMRLESIPNDGLHAQFKRRIRRWWERLTSLFLLDHIYILTLLYCLFFFFFIRILLIKILRLERRNECSLQSRKNSTRTSTKEAWWT